MTHRPALALLAMLALALPITGCTDNTDRENKREMDRLSIDLTRAQKERDQYKAELADTQARLRQTQDQLEQTRRQLQSGAPTPPPSAR